MNEVKFTTIDQVTTFIELITKVGYNVIINSVYEDKMPSGKKFKYYLVKYWENEEGVMNGNLDT